MNQAEQMLMLGKMSAQLEALQSGQDEIKAQLTQLDGRLRGVEKQAAGYGALSGGIVAVCVGLIKAKLGGA